MSKVVQKNREALGIQAGQLPPEGIACRRIHRRIEPIGLMQGLHALDRLHPVARHAAQRGQVQPEATLILTKDPHGLRGRLSP